MSDHLKANADLDPAPAFFVLAWDTFRAPVFDYDEALRPARAVGVELDRDLTGRLVHKSGSNLTLWDSTRRAATGALGPAGGPRGMIDRLTGYFDAGAPALAARGVEGIVRNEGRMRIRTRRTAPRPRSPWTTWAEPVRVTTDAAYYEETPRAWSCGPPATRCPPPRRSLRTTRSRQPARR